MPRSQNLDRGLHITTEKTMTITTHIKLWRRGAAKVITGEEKLALHGITTPNLAGICESAQSSLAGESFNLHCVCILVIACLAHFPWDLRLFSRGTPPRGSSTDSPKGG